jgi:rSAM/selenodomain-associated transferase 2
VSMRLSIVIPTLNEARQIKQNVERALSLRPLQVIVADGQSEDDTADVACSAGAFVLLSPRGRGNQLNAGAMVASGDVLLFLHADCWLEPDATRQIELALANPKTVGGAFRQQIDHPGRVFRWLEWGNAARARWWKLPYGDQGIFLRRDVFVAVGGFAEVPLMEDVLLMRKLRRRHLPIALLDGPLHVDAQRWLSQGVVRQTIRNWLLLVGLRLGISPDRLAKFYGPSPVRRP